MNMERYSDEAIRIIDELHTERIDYQSEYIPLIDAAQKLDAYEATGVEPENICALQEELNQYKKLGDLYRLRELVQADREGRCVVLPCKLGEKVWCLYRECFTNDRSIVVGESTFSYGMIHDFGKTVFLAREAAEKALEEMEGE